MNQSNIRFNIKVTKLTGSYKLPKRDCLGFTLIELMLVLAVIAVGISVAINSMHGNSEKQNSNQMASDVTTMVNNIKNAYSSTTTGYANLTTASAITAKLVPGDLRVSGGNIYSQFSGGVIKIEPSAENFTITYDKVPSAVCNNIIALLGGGVFLKIVVGSTTVYEVGVTDIDATSVAESCKARVNNIIFTAG